MKRIRIKKILKAMRNHLYFPGEDELPGKDKTNKKDIYLCYVIESAVRYNSTYSWIDKIYIKDDIINLLYNLFDPQRKTRAEIWSSHIGFDRVRAQESRAIAIELMINVYGDKRITI